MRTSSPGSRSAANPAKRPCMPPLTTIGASSSAGMRLRSRTFASMALRRSGIPYEGAYRVWLRASASPIAALTASGVFIHGSPPSNRHTFRPSASSSMTRLRTRTISEKPTPSNRRAVRGTVVSVMPASDHAPSARSHREVQDHADEGEQDDEDDPEQLRGGVGRALQDRDDRDDVEDEDQDSD